MYTFPQDILFENINLETKLINLNQEIQKIREYSTQDVSQKQGVSQQQKLINCVENINNFYDLVNKFEVITQDSKLKDLDYFKLCNSLNEVEKLCLDNILPYVSHLIAQPIISKEHDKEFFKNTNGEYYLKHHLQEAQKKENDYSYQLRESYRCLTQNPELRNTLNDPLIKNYIRFITDVENHTRNHLLKKTRDILDNLFQQKIDSPYDITN